jgi:hypothetical protein
MASATESKAARRQIAEEFKERKMPQGIFAIRCAVTGELWVGSSTNLEAAKNSLWFQLRAGLGRCASLQKAWKLNGEEEFAYEIVEKLDDDFSPLLLHDTLWEKKKEYAAQLGAQVL